MTHQDMTDDFTGHYVGTGIGPAPQEPTGPYADSDLAGAAERVAAVSDADFRATQETAMARKKRERAEALARGDYEIIDGELYYVGGGNGVPMTVAEAAAAN